MMDRRSEEKIVARGLKAPGTLLLVKKKLKEIDSGRLRVILSDEDAGEALITYFSQHGCTCETDRAGTDIHVIIDLAKFKDV